MTLPADIIRLAEDREQHYAEHERLRDLGQRSAAARAFSTGAEVGAQLLAAVRDNPWYAEVFRLLYAPTLRELLIVEDYRQCGACPDEAVAFARPTG